MHIHLIVQSHIDPVFMWTWNEGLATTLATCAEAVRKLETYNELIFTRSDALVYKWIKQISPDLAASIRNLVNAKRWTPIGGWWTQADTNLPAGESLVRQALIGRRVYDEELGQGTCESDAARIAYLVDSFGHPATLPKILAHCHFSHFVFGRPKQDQMPLAWTLFRWEADDGSGVDAFRIPLTYTTYDDEVDRIQQVLSMAREEGLDEMMCFVGLGNHGGGPTEQQIQRILNFRAHSEGIQISFSDPCRFFRNVAKRHPLPRHAGPLEPFAVGCYSAAAFLKRAHDNAQCQLLRAEKSLVMAGLAQQRPASDADHKTLEECWRDLLFVQFHDLLPGTAIRRGLEDATNIANGVTARANRVETLTLAWLTSQIDTSAEGYVQFAVYSLSNLDRTVWLEYEPWLYWQSWSKYQLVDINGQDVPYQRIEADAAAPAQTRLIIKLQLAANGYQVLRVCGPEADFSNLAISEDGKYCPCPSDAADRMSTPRYDLRIDSLSGNITTIRHKVHDIPLFENHPLLDSIVIGDQSDTWSAKERGYSGEIRRFGNPSLSIIESGPLRWSTRLRRRLDPSDIEQEIRLFDESDLIEFHHRIDWQHPWSVLKVLVPSPFKSLRVRRGLAFGSDIAPVEGREFAFQNWILISPEQHDPSLKLKALAIIVGPGLHAADVQQGAVRLTLLRSPLYSHEQISRTYPPGPRHDHMDLGRHDGICFGILPLFDEPNIAELVERSVHLLQPGTIITTHRHPGNLLQKGQFLRIKPDHISLSALKPADDGNGYIVRLWETTGRDTRGMLEVDGQTLAFVIRRHALLALRLVKEGSTWRCSETNGLEQ